tara:strand:+ start:139 stop:1464 length:1326 start_codon:yes stop_codon:yes gene_type:complete
MKQVTLKTLEQIKAHIRTAGASLYTGARTSTVIPFEKMESLGDLNLTIVDCSGLPQSMELDGEFLHIKGPVSWKDAKNFARSKGVEVMTSPTEELAAIPAGVATSCTGERCFGHGTLRSQVHKLRYINYEGEEIELASSNKLDLLGAEEKLTNYQASYAQYESFKNAPFPRFLNETDLLTGTEGQLGFISEVWLKTTPLVPLTYLFIKLPCWDQDTRPHLEIFEKVQGLRTQISACELLDAHCLATLPKEKMPADCEGRDLVFLEIKDQDFEMIYEVLLSKLTTIREDDIFQMGANACHALRMEVPRAVFEQNTKMGVTKKGTDVQVAAGDFGNLLNHYKEMTKIGVPYNLFGHFGDAHLHFNFMPTPDKEPACQNSLLGLYQKVFEWGGSPFAEHGIGFLKRPFIEKFYTSVQRELFTELKRRHDPKNHFFPQGFMGTTK